MDWQFWSTIIKIMIFLPFVIVLIFITAKVGGEKLKYVQNGKFIKMLERVPLSKDNHLVAVKIGEKGYVISSSPSNVQILRELTEEELLKLERNNKSMQYLSLSSKNNNLEKILNKLKLKKESKNE